VVGGIPVWVHPVVSLDLSLNGSFSSSVTATAGVSASFSAGVNYANGSYSPYRSASLGFSSSLQARAGGTARVEVVPRIDFKIYGVAGPYVRVGPFAQLDVNLLGNPWWKITAGVEAGAGLTLDLGFKKFSYDAPTIDLFSRVVAEASSGYPGPSSAGGTASTGTVGSGYNVTLTASGGAPPYSWYRVSGVLPPGISLTTDGHLVGTPQAAGTWTFVVRVIDAAGNRVSADQTVTVSFANPQPPPGRTVTLSKGTSAQGKPGCSSTACRYMVVSFSGFSAGNHTVVCNASNAPAFYSYVTSLTTTAYCYYGYPGQSVWATVDGVSSNHVTW